MLKFIQNSSWLLKEILYRPPGITYFSSFATLFNLSKHCFETLHEVSKCGVFSGSYFPVLRLNTKIYWVNLWRIQPGYDKVRTKKISVFWHYWCTEIYLLFYGKPLIVNRINLLSKLAGMLLNYVNKWIQPLNPENFDWILIFGDGAFKKNFGTDCRTI